MWQTQFNTDITKKNTTELGRTMNRIAGSDNKSVFFTHDVSLQTRYIQYVVISYMTAFSTPQT
jgi:hypothetical protein